MRDKELELNFAVVTQSGETVPSIFEKKTTAKYLNWGEYNQLPNYLWDSYLKNSNMQAIVNTTIDYIIGEGSTTNAPIDEDTISLIINDYIIFGGYAVECLRNSFGNICKINYLNIMNLRVDEDLTTAYISDQWMKYSGKNVKTLPLFNPDEKQSHFIYFYRGNITRNIYPIPTYIGALKSIEILNEVRNFHLNNLQNNFSASCIINLNNGNIKQRELKEIEEQLKEKYTGSNSAGKFVLINGGDKDHSATIERLNQDDFGDLYKALDESSKEDIFTAFRINPMLLGVNVATGFSKEEFQQAAALYNSTTIRPLRRNIKKSFQKLGYDIDFKDIKINWGE